MTNKNIEQNSSEDWQFISDIASRFEYPKQDVESKWNKFNTLINPEAQIPELKVVYKNTINWKKWAVAAMLFMTLGFGFYLMKNNQTEISKEIVYNSNDDIKNITLEDGTKITLNKKSTLTVHVLNETEREVSLTGEGAFEVTHNGSPFKVKANDKIIHVLGTIFNVKNIKDKPFSVSLKEGKISLEHKNNEVIMRPGESVKILNDEILNTSSKTVNPMSWINNKLEYKETDMLTITNELSDHYQVKFNCQMITNTKLTISFDNLTAEEAAELLSKVAGQKVTVIRP